MRELEQFHPYLTGSVLNGNAAVRGHNLQLFTDNSKAVELYFIDRDIPYKGGRKTASTQAMSRASCPSIR